MSALFSRPNLSPEFGMGLSLALIECRERRCTPGGSSPRSPMFSIFGVGGPLWLTTNLLAFHLHI